MELQQILGKTWALIGKEYIPLYRLDERKCILFDTGYPYERKKLVEALEENRLEILAIFCTHAHIDHTGNGSFLQKKYHCPMYLSPAEQGLMCNVRNMKAYRMTPTPKETAEVMGDTVAKNITIIPTGANSVTLDCGVEIGVLPTEGHSAEHLCFVTPDNVCYLGDALLSEEQMDAKLPYNLDTALTLETHEKMKKYDYPMYILAHFGTCSGDKFQNLVEQNQNLLHTRASEICRCAGGGKTLEQITLDLCKQYELSSRKPERILIYQRNIRLFLEYLTDKGDVYLEMRSEGICYCAVNSDNS